MRDGATRFPTAGNFRHDTCMLSHLKKPNHGLFVHSLHSYACAPRGPRGTRQTGGQRSRSSLNHHLEVRFPVLSGTHRMAALNRQNNTKFRDVATSEIGQCRGNYGPIRLCKKFSQSDEFAQQFSSASVGSESGQKYKKPVASTACLMKV